MKTSNIKPRLIALALVAGGALAGAGSAFAQSAPGYAPDGYAQPRLIPADVSINIGWHGDRYWDGRRYWDHDEWMHRHPHARDPYRGRGHERDRDMDRPPHGY